MYNNLKIFKGTEHILGTSIDSNGVINTAVYLNEVSTGLYESVTLFFLEDVEYNGSILLNKPISESLNSTNFEFKWDENVYESSDIILYGIKVENSISKIDLLTEQVSGLIDNSILSGLNTEGIKIVSSADNEAIQVNIALSSKEEGRHQRTLLVYSNDGVDRILVAKVFVYGEVVGEDERLKILLQNFGATLDDEDFILFKEHDITEMSPDYILLNQKRKELLLELSNIKPFIGTYKAILNAIDFFGYDSLTLKEYWLNINTGSSSFGKLYAVPVPNSSKYGDAVRKTINVEVPSSNLKKTNRFSLVYKINTPDGGVDQWDIPTVEEVFEFTPEEVLIKLYGLKRKLQKEYLPLNARIIDIVGEGDFFTQKNLNIWNNQNPIAFFSEGLDIDFNYSPSQRKLFIEDVSLILKKVYDPNDLVGTGYTDYHSILNTSFSDYNTLTSQQLTDLKTAIGQFYQDYYNSPLQTFNTDIPVGCPVILNGENSFTTTWDEANFTWNDVVDPNDNLLVTWDNWWKRWVYEIEWIISGPRGLRYEFRGPIDDYLQFPIFLPFNGEYNVEMRSYDLFGHRSYDIKTGLLNVNLKEIEMYGFYKTLRKNTWDDRKNISWNNVGGYWDLPLHNPNLIEDLTSSFYGLDRINYVHFNPIEGPNFSTVFRYDDIYSETGYSETTGPYFWDNCDFNWNDTSDLWWNATRIGNDLAASFLITEIENGSVLTINHINPTTNLLEIGTITISSPTPVDSFDISGWELIVNELNNSTDPIISKFIYNSIVEDDGINPVVLYILCVGKIDSRTYDFDDVSITNGTIIGKVNYVSYNPTFDDVDIFNTWRNINKSTHVTFSLDNSKMAGLKLKRWNIINNTYPEKSDIYYSDMVLTYLFKYSGDYTISVEVEDTNGNTNIINKNILKVN